MWKRKGWVLLLLCAAVVLLCGCSGGVDPAEPTVPRTTDFDYDDARRVYQAGARTVECTLTCSNPALTLTYQLQRAEDGGYTLTDPATGESEQVAADGNLNAMLRRANYVAPYETELTGEGGEYTATLSGEAFRTYLLSGSSLFDGYAQNGNVTVPGDCRFTVYADGNSITGYSYDFTLNVVDGADTFTAEIQYKIEVLS